MRRLRAMHEQLNPLMRNTNVMDTTIAPIYQETENLLRLFESKYHLLSQMQDMSIRQSELVAEHDVTELLSLLSRKQQLMESLQTVQSQLIPYQSHDPEKRVWVSPERRKQCQALVAKCDQLIQALLVMENRSLQTMNLQRDVVGAQLKQNIDALQIENAYHTTDGDPPEMTGLLSLTG